MEVKGLLEKIRQQEKEKKDYFFALEIETNFVKSAIWLVDEGKVKVVSLGSRESWTDSLLEAADASLSSAAEGFTPEEEASEPNKVIFGLPVDWIEGEKIKSERLKALKDLSQKLELKPVGFVVTNEAISHYLKTTEGVPPTAILLALNKKRVSLTLIHLGKVKTTQVIERSQNLGDDVVEGLARFQGEEPLPARILLWDGEEELEEAKQALVDYPWQEKEIGGKEGVFLHLPKVEILSTDFDIKAVALAGGKEIARASGIMADFKTEKKTEEPTPQPEEGVEKEAVLEKFDFGFVEGKDVIEEKPPQVEPQTTPQPEPKEEVEETEAPPRSFLSGLKPKFSFAWLKKINLGRFLMPFKGFISGMKLAGRTRLIGLLVLIFLFIFFVLAFGLYWYLPKASVVILVEPKVIEEEFTIKLDPSLSTANKEELILPAQEMEETISGDKKIGTTGTKLTGEKAKGEVTIYNGTSQEKTFSAGTILTSSSDLEFTLDEEVTVASRGATPLDPPGEAKVKATASEFGTESNLASGTEFSVGNFSRSDFIAKNESAFTGGTSREIQVVAAEDHEELLARLSEELENQAIDQIQARLPLGTKLLTESLESEEVEETFSQAVDEEATEVSLSLKTKFTVLVYTEDELRDLLAEGIEDKIPAGFEFKKEESDVSFELEEVTSEGVAVFAAQLEAKLIPELDLEEISKNLVGKYPQLGKTYLDNLPNVVGTEIKITPRLPSRLLTFPRKVENIKIEIEIK